MNIVNLCINGASYIVSGVFYLFNRAVQCCKGKPRAKKTRANAHLKKELGLPNVLISKTPKGTRRPNQYTKSSVKHLEIVSSHVQVIGYKQNVIKIIKLLELQSLDVQVDLLQKKGHECSIKYNKDDAYEELVSKWAEGYINLRKLGFESCYQKEIENKADLFFDEILSEAEKLGSLDLGWNGSLCWNTLWRLFLNCEVEGSENRKMLCQFKSIQSTDDIMVERVDSIVSEAIKGLERIKEENYFSIFRIMTDPSSDLKTKYTAIENWFLIPYYQSQFDSFKLFITFNKSVLPFIGNMTCYVSQLQVLLDGLKIIKAVPKTKENIKILLDICICCIKYYDEDKLEIDAFMQEFKSYGMGSSKYVSDYFSAKYFLDKLKQKLTYLISEPRKEILLFGESDEEMIDRLDNKGKAPIKSRKQKNQLENQRIIQGGKRKVRSELSVSKREKSEKVSRILIEEDSDDESFGKVKREQNELMEVFRQMLESDRKEKLERQEMKLKKPELEIETDEVLVIESKPEIKKLSNKHQKTLNALLKEKPEHLVISGAAVESLIQFLGGRVESVGNGKKSIFWGNSNRLAGSYEVTHGKDRAKHLTSDFAKNVADAIQAGIENGYIARETVYGV